jgi:hypothetical protein
MSRLSKYLWLIAILVFILACNTVTKPVKDVQDVASTAKAFATSMPFETLQAITTSIPMQTLEALPSSMPAIETAMPNIENMFNPQGEPVSTWKDIPVMDGATAGQEFSSTSYSFAVPSTPTDVQTFYNAKMKDLGWSSLFGSSVTDDGGLLLFQKDKALLTVTIVKNPNKDQTGSVVNFQLVAQ